MPVMGGLEFLKSVAGVEAAKGVPVVTITTEGSKGGWLNVAEAHAREISDGELVSQSLDDLLFEL